MCFLKFEKKYVGITRKKVKNFDLEELRLFIPKNSFFYKWNEMGEKGTVKQN